MLQTHVWRYLWLYTGVRLRFLMLRLRLYTFTPQTKLCFMQGRGSVEMSCHYHDQTVSSRARILEALVSKPHWDKSVRHRCVKLRICHKMYISRVYKYWVIPRPARPTNFVFEDVPIGHSLSSCRSWVWRNHLFKLCRPRRATSSNTGFIHTRRHRDRNGHKHSYTDKHNGDLSLRTVCHDLLFRYTLMIYSSSFLFHWTVENNCLRICEVGWREGAQW